MPEYTLGAVEDFDEGRGYEVEADGLGIALFKVDGEFFAIANRCPHKDAPLHTAGLPTFTEREDGEFDPEEVIDEDSIMPWLDPRGKVDCEDERCYISCPHHRLEFDLESGENDLTGMRIGTFDTKVEDSKVKLIV